MLGNLDCEWKEILRANTKSQVTVQFVLILLLAFSGVAAFAQAASTSGSATLPSGTQIMVRTVDAVDSETSQPDQRFRGTLETNLTADGVVVAPKGTTVF